MVKFIVYEKQTGKIIRTGSCPDDAVKLQSDGNEVIVGEACDEKHYINGETICEKPPRPSEYHVFDYVGKEWVDGRTVESEAAKVRMKRELLFKKSDWTQLPDVPLATKEAWATYRQALRDVTNQPGFPFEVVWPTPPA